MALARSSEPALIVVGQRRPLLVHLREIWSYRELIAGLVRKELKVRYKNSALGFLWSMIQPIFLLVIYSVVFTILGAGFADFGIWLLCGLIVWNFVSTSLLAATKSVTANGYLVGKVRFPRAVLPLATVGAAAVHFLLQMAAFGIVLLVTQHQVAWSYLPVLPIATLAMVVLCAALSLLLAALNVYARDTEHLLDLAVLGWFWLTPILYQYMRVYDWLENRGWPGNLALLNPLTDIVICFQRALYGTSHAGVTRLLPDADPWWYLRNVTIVGVISTVLLLVALQLFDRAEGNFAEAI
jgi:ABC-2 type transport system permease protein